MAHTNSWCSSVCGQHRRMYTHSFCRNILWHGFKYQPYRLIRHMYCVLNHLIRYWSWTFSISLKGCNLWKNFIAHWAHGVQAETTFTAQSPLCPYLRLDGFYGIGEKTVSPFAIESNQIQKKMERRAEMKKLGTKDWWGRTVPGRWIWWDFGDG